MQDFLRPIVTPFELELALTSKAWTGDYILDFAQLLESSDFGQDAGTVEVEQGEEDEGEAEAEDGEAPVFSAVTGTYRHPKKYYQRGFKGESRSSIATHPVTIRVFLRALAHRLLSFSLLRTDADDLTSQASALAIRDQSSAVARVLGSAAGQPSFPPLPPLHGLTSLAHRRVHVNADIQGSRAAVRARCACCAGDGPGRRYCARVWVREGHRRRNGVTSGLATLRSRTHQITA